MKVDPRLLHYNQLLHIKWIKTKMKIRFVIGMLLIIFCFNVIYFSDYNTVFEIQIDDEQIEEGFVTFATKSHFGLLEVLLTSLHEFSTKPIVVYGVDSDVSIHNDTKRFPRMIKRKITSDECGRSIYFCKPFVIAKCNIKYGVYLDVDNVVNWNIDQLFTISKAWNGTHTLSPTHPQDPNNQRLHMLWGGILKKSMPYVHGHVIFNYRTLDFVKKWFSMTKHSIFNKFNYDETALNTLLWIVNAKHQICLFDINYEFFDAYLKGFNISYYNDLQLPVWVATVHGDKQQLHAESIFNRMKDQMQTRTIFNSGKWYEDGNCCAKSSKQTNLHPKICYFPKNNYDKYVVY